MIEGHSRFRLGQALVSAQIALSLVMVVIAVLLVGSWRRVLAIDTGFKSDGVWIATVGTGSAGVPADQQALTFNTLLERIRTLPDVTSAAAAWITPLGQNARVIVNAEGFTELPAIDVESRLNHVSAGYFRTIGIPMLSGRDFGPAEASGSPAVVIVNKELAQILYGRTDVVGHRFRVRRNAGLGESIEIIGVVADTTWGSLREARQPIVYDPLSQIEQPGRGMNFVMRTDGAPGALAPAVKAAVAAVNPRLALTQVSLAERVNDSVRLPRTLATLSGFFGALALLLSMVGLYGILSYAVARRRNEIGVRIALGASRSRVIRMVVGESGRLVSAGIAIGAGLSLAAARLISSFLYGVTPTDPRTLLTAGVTLIVVAAAAAFLPARRAVRMNPVMALREE